jgi:PKD domain
VLLVARSLDPTSTGFRPIFEVSHDGRTFVSLDPGPAPDYGPDSFASTLDATHFPSGPLWLRARWGRWAWPVNVHVDRLPIVSCMAEADGLELTVDCSNSSDPDGTIVAYEYRFGEGEPEYGPAPTLKSASAVASHLYNVSGIYTLRVTAYDNLGLWDTWERVLQVSACCKVIDISQPSGCGCEQLYLMTGGMGALGDVRRPVAGGGFERPPLGPDPDYPTVNYEIEALLTPGSDAAQCTEGQDARRTSIIANRAGVVAADKHACSAGRTDLPNCPPGVNAFCHTHTCHGGSMDGQNCDGNAVTPGGQVVTQARLCEIGRGRCASNSDGICAPFPNVAGGPRGNDDFRAHSPGDEGIKMICPGCRSPRWFDRPGHQQKNLAAHYLYFADVLAFARGPAPGKEDDCQCHFRVEVEWFLDAGLAPGNQPGHGGGNSGIRLVHDAETFDCTLIR